MNVLITGANRGIGAGFVRHYLAQRAEVWACYRSSAGELASIHSDQLHLLQWNVASQNEPHGELPDSIDLLINNAGIYGPGKDGQSLARIIHKYCRALACSFARHEYFGRCPYAMATIILPKYSWRTKARRDHHCDL